MTRTPLTGAPQRKRSRRVLNRLTRLSAKKMLLAMAEQSPNAPRDVTQDFLTTGRAGRRNALPDILGEYAVVTTSDLPDKFKRLSTQDEGESSSSTAQNAQADGKPSTSNSKNEKTS